MAKQTVPPLPLPKHWPRRVRSAAVHAITLARLALTTARGQANSADHGSGRIARLTEEILLNKEEMRIKDARMAGIPAHRAPGHPAVAGRPRVVAGSNESVPILVGI